MFRRRLAAFTLIELLVVVAIIAMLISILLPSLQQARDNGKKAVCLANLRGISVATQEYANEDQMELLMPIHQMQVNNTALFSGDFAGTRWAWMTANWFSFGGATAIDEFLCVEGQGPRLGQGRTRYWGAQTRPLNKYLYPSITEDPEDDRYEHNLKQFQCPGDRGYPDHDDIDDSPRANARRECYRTLGNSYRGSLACAVNATPTGPTYRGAFAVGPWGHKVSDIVNVSRLVLLGEPTFFNMIGANGDTAPVVVVTGWHRQLLKDNVAYCDGSARTTTVERDANGIALKEIRPSKLVDESWANNGFRATTFQIDTYPTPGALIWAASDEIRDGLTSGAEGRAKWPYARYRHNLVPVRPPWESQ